MKGPLFFLASFSHPAQFLFHLHCYIFCHPTCVQHIVNMYSISFAGKTLLAKAVANQTSATFLRVVGSELIQKYLVGINNNTQNCMYLV